MHRISVRKPEGTRPLGRPRRRWENTIKIALSQMDCDPGDLINLAEDRDQWRPYVRAVRISGLFRSQLVS